MLTSNARTTSIVSLIGLLSLLALTLAGCTGTSNTQASKMRFINAIPNGGTATFSDGGVFEGNETFFNQSAYLTVPSKSSLISFFLTANPATSFTSASTNLTNGTFYTSIAMGRQDVTTQGAAGFPQVQIVQDEQTAPAAGKIRLRIFSVAPDLSGINVLVNGTNEANNINYPNLGSYITLAAGNLTIQAVLNVGGTVEAGPTTFTGIVAGHHYTAFVVETATTPTYAIDLIDDTTNTLLP